MKSDVIFQIFAPNINIVYVNIPVFPIYSLLFNAIAWVELVYFAAVRLKLPECAFGMSNTCWKHFWASAPHGKS
jgi:hypothetical protein